MLNVDTDNQSINQYINQLINQSNLPGGIAGGLLVTGTPPSPFPPSENT